MIENEPAFSLDFQGKNILDQSLAQSAQRDTKSRDTAKDDSVDSASPKGIATCYNTKINFENLRPEVTHKVRTPIMKSQNYVPSTQQTQTRIIRNDNNDGSRLS